MCEDNSIKVNFLDGRNEKVLELLHLENFSKDELCDIYWNLVDGVWDRRIGRKPKDFDFLPDEPKRFKKYSKKEYLAPCIKKIEELTSNKERRHYWMVVVTKYIKEQEFEKWWSEISQLYE